MPQRCSVPLNYQQLPVQVCRESLGRPHARPWFMATSQGERLKFWLCCEPWQHSHQFSWGHDSPWLINGVAGALATATFAHPQRAAPGGLPHGFGAALLPAEVPGTVPKPLPSWETWGTSKRHCSPGYAVSNRQPHENQQRLPKSPAAPWTLPPPGRKAKVQFLTRLLHF